VTQGPQHATKINWN